MEKKSLGRGLDNISDIFLSTRKDKKKLGGFSSEKLRDETCESCARIIRDSNKAPKCKIFTFENKKYGVHYMDTVSLTSGSYEIWCQSLTGCCPNSGSTTIASPVEIGHE